MDQLKDKAGQWETTFSVFSPWKRFTIDWSIDPKIVIVTVFYICLTEIFDDIETGWNPGFWCSSGGVEYRRLIDWLIFSLQTKATSSTDLDRLPPVFVPVSPHPPPEYRTESLPPAEEWHNVAGFDVAVVNDLTADDLVPEMRVRLAPRWQNPADRRHVMHETVRERIQERAAAVSPAVGEAYSRWFAQFDTNRRSGEERSVERTRQKENLAVSEELSMSNAETVPKFIKKPWETRRNTTVTEESEEREVPDKIVIPEEAKRHSAIYQKGDTFYDGNGEFLYRVPGLSGFRTRKTA